MRINSPDSDSFALISNSNASERINSVSQFGKTSVNCCPACNSRRFHQNKNGEFVCNHCKTVFTTPGTTTLRTRKACPACGSLSINRKKSSKEYHCSICRSYFSTPTLKLTPDLGYLGKLPSICHKSASKTGAV
ncbi:hypothetical protein [Methanosarcina sp. UBA289]|uniref:hypothetical protein n=1 Tax=Methanosarcina sp. UBA289 TaxID=1915574 RepID=UPI0025F56EC4|nr:hypothetical protein [Methanosarcina sp. UBA289]